jgi:transcriptional regulator with XRE-family HTH domain
VAAAQTPTAAQGLGRGHDLGAVSGYVLKLLRGSMALTQSDLAERIGVDVSTVQGWESGRRALGALRSSDLVRLRNKLILLGADPQCTAVLYEAIEADTILMTAVDAGDRAVPPALHSLASAVHRRSLVNLITWPFTGLTPPQLRALPAAPGRGPVAAAPVLNSSDRNQFFDQMLVTADAPGSTPILRRQASYLLGFDQRQSTSDWLAREHRRAMRKTVGEQDVPTALAVRSAAVALARQGDHEPVSYFIDHTLSSDTQTLANLNYWAYWIGEIPDVYADDSFLIGVPAHAWSGTALIAHLADRLQAPGHADLNIHSLWSLVLARPHLLEQHQFLRDKVHDSVDRALSDGFTGRARDNLANLRCAVRLSRR